MSCCFKVMRDQNACPVFQPAENTFLQEMSGD